MDFGYPSNTRPSLLCPAHTHNANQSFTTRRRKWKNLLALLTRMGRIEFGHSWAGANVNYNFWRTASSFCTTSKPRPAPTSSPTSTAVPCAPSVSSTVVTIWSLSTLPACSWNWISATASQASSASGLSSSFITRTRRLIPSTISCTRPSNFPDFDWVSGLK